MQTENPLGTGDSPERDHGENVSERDTTSSRERSVSSPRLERDEPDVPLDEPRGVAPRIHLQIDPSSDLPRQRDSESATRGNEREPFAAPHDRVQTTRERLEPLDGADELPSLRRRVVRPVFPRELSPAS